MNSVKYHIFCSPKKGSKKTEYEDAFSPLYSVGYSSNIIRLAIADGATESSFSKEWADILVDHFSQDEKFDLRNTDYLSLLSTQWGGNIKNDDLPWYAQSKLKHGAHVAFLGITVALDKQKVIAIAVGDCCFFIIRDNKLISAFPLVDASQFNNTPDLIASDKGQNITLPKKIINFETDIQQGDLLLMASDAFSAWFLSEVKKNNKPWNFIKEIYDDDLRVQEKKRLYKNWLQIFGYWDKEIAESKAEDYFIQKVFNDGNSLADEKMDWLFKNWIFSNWLENLRNTGLLKNDDVSLLCFEIK